MIAASYSLIYEGATFSEQGSVDHHHPHHHHHHNHHHAFHEYIDSLHEQWHHFIGMDSGVKTALGVAVVSV
jgi:hypothetical protein